MTGTERIVQLRLGEKVIVQAVPWPVPERSSRREDMRPVFQELERYIGLHWEQIRYLAGGRVEDATDLVIERDTLQLVEILKQFGTSAEEIERETKKILLKRGMSDREALLHAQAFSGFLGEFEE